MFSILQNHFNKFLFFNSQLGSSNKLRQPLLQNLILFQRNNIDFINTHHTFFHLLKALSLVYSTNLSLGTIAFLYPLKKSSKLHLSLSFLPNSILASSWSPGSLTNFFNLKKNSFLNSNSLFFKSENLPDLVIFLDFNPFAFQEAQSLLIPSVSLIDSWVDPFSSQYPILTNNQSFNLLQLYLNLFQQIILLSHLQHILSFSQDF